MYMAILMFGDAGRRDRLSRPRLPDLSLDDRVHRRAPRPGADAGGERLRLLGRGDAGADHAADPAPDPQFARQPDRRRHAARGDRQARRRPRALPDVAILSDEIYGQLTYDGLAHQIAARLSRDPRPADPARRLVEDLRDDRLAARLFGLAEGAGCEAARKLAVNSYSCVNSAAQFAGIAALTGPQDVGRGDAAPSSTARRKVVVDGLNRLPGVSAATPKGAFYAFPNIAATGWKAKPLASALLEEAGVATIGGPDFGVYGEGYLRLSYANSLEAIERALALRCHSWRRRARLQEACARRWLAQSRDGFAQRCAAAHRLHSRRRYGVRREESLSRLRG